jgi:hypothetical protein
MRLTLLAVALLSVPTALASWQSSFAGVAEPSTLLDRQGPYMFQDPPVGPHDRIIFDLIHTPTSALEPLPHHEAVLGAWRDCNDDGILGGAAGDDYPALFLLDLSRCPAGTRHNDGATVRELLAIGPGALYPDIADADAVVWLDGLLPSQDAPAPKTWADDALSFSAASGRWSSPHLWPTQPTFATGYAHVGAASLSSGSDLPSSVVGVYGAPLCAGPISGQNWDCDPAHWASTPRVGDTYQLRDVDCTEGTAC